VTVYLVGAGPGDPSLITVRGASLIERAEVLVHDRLVDRRLLLLAPSTAHWHDVGKSPGSSIRQEEINDLLVRLGREHRCVVRLKGGDPLVFGRGGEEALALASAGIDYEIIPGVSSVNGAVGAAGIPLTHRGRSLGFTVVTGHGADRATAGGPSPVDWDALARLGGTIVILMGIAHRREIAERLISGGRAPSTPVAVVENGTLVAQRTTRTTLSELGNTDPRTPAIIVVGAVASIDLRPRRSGPLEDWRVVVTRSEEQGAQLGRALVGVGAEPLFVPTIAIEAPLDGGTALRQALDDLPRFDWIAFTSANAVEAVFGWLRDARALGTTKVAAIGHATAAVLRTRGVEADLVPERSDARGLAAAFGAPGRPGVSVLAPQGDRAGSALVEELSAAGYKVRPVTAYRTVPVVLGDEALAVLSSADAVTFTSGSTVEGLLGSVGLDRIPPVVASIGPVTTSAATAHGLEVSVEAKRPSVTALVDALAAYATQHPLGARGGL
jgi:uroporphyrinogen III methyltransferase/synthase